MKVHGGPGRPPVTQVQDKKASVQHADNPQEAKPTSTGERVAVSSLSKLLAQARAPDSPDMAKVEALRGSIQAGTFKVDHERVAEAMLREEV
jgi:flagellar biosynthesis anti-sigma factor FlgM